MASNNFSVSSINGQHNEILRSRITNDNANGNEGFNGANDPNHKSTEKEQSSVNMASSINPELHIVHPNRAIINSSVSTGIGEGPSAQQSLKNNHPNHVFESEYLSSTNIAPAAFYENLIEELDKSIIMLKKSLDKVLEMRVTMAQLKLSLKEISSPNLVRKAEELNTQLASMEKNHKTFNEMILSLTHEIRPFDNNDTNEVN